MWNLFTNLTKGKDRFVSLMISLVVLLLLYPVMIELGMMRIYGLVLSVELIMATYSIGQTKRHLWTAISLYLPALALHIAAFVHPTRWTMVMADSAVMLFLGYVIFVVYRAVLRESRFTENNVAGAISVYLLIGIFWSVVYSIVATLQPESFSTYEIHEVGGMVRYAGGADFLYFSFVTLATLGYGDISPKTPLAQTASWVEGVVGQLFIAITIASLVAMKVAGYQAKARQNKDTEDTD
jgi:hypothetical protein